MGNSVVEYVDCYHDLANAIILQAVKDYKNALFRLDDNPNNRDARYDKKSLEKFFRSKWYATLTEVDPNRLMSDSVLEKTQGSASEDRGNTARNGATARKEASNG